MTGTGGGPYNVLLNLAKSGARFPLAGAGLVGQDDTGTPNPRGLSPAQN